MNSEDRTFKVKLTSAQSQPIKIKLNKIDSVVDVKGDFNNDKSSKSFYYNDKVGYDNKN
jgi:hypothetical protein